MISKQCLWLDETLLPYCFTDDLLCLVVELTVMPVQCVTHLRVTIETQAVWTKGQTRLIGAAPQNRVSIIYKVTYALRMTTPDYLVLDQHVEILYLELITYPTSHLPTHLCIPV